MSPDYGLPSSYTARDPQSGDKKPGKGGYYHGKMGPALGEVCVRDTRALPHHRGSPVLLGLHRQPGLGADVRCPPAGCGDQPPERLSPAGHRLRRHRLAGAQHAGEGQVRFDRSMALREKSP